MEVRAFKHLLLRLAVVFSASLFIVGCAHDEPGEVTVERDKPLPDQVITGFDITETSMGKKDWNMKAQKAFLYERRNVLEAQEVEVTFFGEEGEIRSVLKADYGRLNRASDDMEARGSVVITGSDGVVLETESVKWLSGTRKIVSDDSVKVIRNDDVLTGWGFRGDPDLGSFSILRQMKARIRARQDITEGGEADDSSAQD
jgi:LPS export ABC transporter protein LptC